MRKLTHSLGEAIALTCYDLSAHFILPLRIPHVSCSACLQYIMWHIVYYTVSVTYCTEGFLQGGRVLGHLPPQPQKKLLQQNHTFYFKVASIKCKNPGEGGGIPPDPLTDLSFREVWSAQQVAVFPLT